MKDQTMSLQSYTPPEWTRARVAYTRWVARGRTYTHEDVLMEDAYRLLDAEAELAELALRLGTMAESLSWLASDGQFRLGIAREIVESAASRLIAAYTDPQETVAAGAEAAPAAHSRQGKGIILPRKS